jgi:alkylation response protein AidB-like acyl-CoA dehydrogenase
MYGPLGTATPDGAGYRITGRWPFVSGCLHAGWHALGVRLRGDDSPHRPLAFVHPDDVQVLDTWNSWGLRGTGSTT